MTSELFDCFACGALWVASEWIVSLVFAFWSNRAERIDADLVNMRLLGFGTKRPDEDAGVRGDSSRCARTESERSRQKIREGIRNRIYSRTIILPVITRNSSKETTILRSSTEDMSQVPLISPEESPMMGPSTCNMVILEVGLPGDTWRYCVERERLAERSEWFRAMLVGPLAPAPSDPPPLLKLQHVEKRAFDYLLRYLRDEPINFQSVSTARSTLDAAHQYLCSELARLAVQYLERNLNSNTVLEIYQGLSLYANHVTSSYSWSSPTAPPAPGDDAGEIAIVCTRLLHSCLNVIDSEPEVVISQEHFEDLTSAEVEELSCRDTLRLSKESILFHALDRWAASECRRNGVEPSASNKRSALSDDVWYNVRYPLMTDREFIEGPMASGILSSEESAYIVSRILGHAENYENEEFRNSITGPLPRLTSTPRTSVRPYEDQSCRMSKPGKKECQDNRKNRRKECANQGHRTCARIGNCLVRVLACIFD
ncbi:PREDICTED: BTB/POZ domain-containing protein 6-B isoform X1 [Eufriesea mexicana]|uniref:BTB/POZ domain-containing protein 6-B isoform X1 n=1 Tax=Eufriesea mexicana TaxID=516756 RepID=UPI00083C6D75|nr:PREDICTED: BTB/POZ domain-containing protein 6-B isoform X1 [Eufriesea mexicana]